MDGEVRVLKPGRAKALLLIAACAAFVALGVLVASDPGVGALRRAIMWAGAAFFGLCALVGAALLLPGSHSMRLAPEGLTLRVWFREYRYPWDAFGPFRAERVRSSGPLGPKVVVFDWSPGYRRSQGIEDTAASNKDRFGHEGSFAAHLYRGVSAEEVAGLLNAYRDIYGRAEPYDGQAATEGET